MTDDLDRQDGSSGDDLTPDPWMSDPLVPPDLDATEEFSSIPEEVSAPVGKGADTLVAGEAAEGGTPTDDTRSDAESGTAAIEAIGPDANDDSQPESVSKPSPFARVQAWFGRLHVVLSDPSWRHGPRESFRMSLIVTAALGFAYWLTNWPLPRLLSSHPDLNLYLVQPLIWLTVSALALHGWQRLDGRPPLSRMLIGIAFLVGLFHVAILLIAGVVWSFGDSPTAGRLIDYPKNLLYIGTLLLGLEASRAYLFHVWQRYGERLAFGLVSALFFVVVIPAAQWAVWDDFDRISTFVGGRWAPALALSVLATFLVKYGGIGLSFAYRFALLGFVWFSPILPDLPWPALLIIGVLVPLASASLVQSIYEDTAEGTERVEEAERAARADRSPYAHQQEVRRKKHKWKGWAVTGALGLLIALFFSGSLGFRMVVVEGISMEPAYERGDLAIVRESIDIALLEVDDVIVFEQAGRSVVHRIVAIYETPGGFVFNTQGDNADRPDPPVSEEQIEGKVVFLIPAIGHLNLWLRGG